MVSNDLKCSFTADESLPVREASMRAGKMIIANYSGKAVDLLLPELEKGMLDPSWRIRVSNFNFWGGHILNYVSSNPRSLLPESCSTRSLVLVARLNWRKRTLLHNPQTMPGELCWRH